MKMWLARDGGLDCLYVLTTQFPKRIRWVNPETKRQCTEFQGQNSYHVCSKYWHRMGGLRLKPGDGPVHVEVTVRVRRVGK